MNLEICSIASSSSGNSYVVRSEEAVILVDAGVTAKKIDEGLAKLKISYQDVDAILITHEHSTISIACTRWSRGDQIGRAHVLTPVT